MNWRTWCIGLIGFALFVGGTWPLSAGRTFLTCAGLLLIVVASEVQPELSRAKDKARDEE